MSSVSYVSSATSSSSGASTSTTTIDTSNDLSDDKTAFLSLLTTQLENQNPLSPVDTTEFTNQLISYSTLEQLMNLNEQVESLVTLQSATSILSSFSYLGCEVEVNGTTTTLQEGEAEWNYVVDDDATNLTLQVTDEDGNIVYSEALTDVTAGTYNYTVSSADLGTDLPDGSSYTLSVIATDSDGNKVETDANAIVTVENIETSGDEITMSAGSVTFTSSDIMSLSKSAA